jgi:hypothetical protein
VVDVTYAPGINDRYQVEAFSAEEVVWYGVYGIKLTSYDDTKRQWLFRARSDPEQSEWLEVGFCSCELTILELLITVLHVVGAMWLTYCLLVSQQLQQACSTHCPFAISRFS